MPGLRTRLRPDAIPCAVAAVPGRERSNPMSLRSLLTAGLVAVGVGMAGPPGSAAAIGSAVERGRYLVESIAGCGNCHSPQDAAGPIRGRELSGGQIGRAHVRTPVTNGPLVCGLLLERKKDTKQNQESTHQFNNKNRAKN